MTCSNAGREQVPLKPLPLAVLWHEHLERTRQHVGFEAAATYVVTVDLEGQGRGRLDAQRAVAVARCNT